MSNRAIISKYTARLQSEIVNKYQINDKSHNYQSGKTSFQIQHSEQGNHSQKLI